MKKPHRLTKNEHQSDSKKKDEKGIFRFAGDLASIDDHRPLQEIRLIAQERAAIPIVNKNNVY